MTRKTSASWIRINGFLIIGVLGLVLMTFGGVRAAFYVIDTDDGLISDWSGIEEFMTDPSGDVANPDEDWINGWVASGTNPGDEDTINFLMEVVGPDALSGEERAAAVFLDCNNNGVMEQDWDAVVAYDRYNNSYFMPWEDMVIVCDGEVQQCGLTDSAYGQITGSDNEFIEWAALIEWLPPNSYSDPGANCQDVPLQIKFGTVDSTVGAPAIIDDADEFLGYNMATSVNLVKLEAERVSMNTNTLLLTGGVLTLFGFGSYYVVSKSRLQKM